MVFIFYFLFFKNLFFILILLIIYWLDVCVVDVACLFTSKQAI